MSKFIVERELSYSEKGSNQRMKLVVGISPPYFLEDGQHGFPFNEGSAACTIEFVGLDEDSISVYGADKLQTLEVAISIDSYLRGMSKKYDFYFSNGEPYFEE